MRGKAVLLSALLFLPAASHMDRIGHGREIAGLTYLEEDPVSLIDVGFSHNRSPDREKTATGVIIS